MTPDLMMLDPASLLVDVNIRTDLHLDAAFVDSIREHGVIVPVVAVRSHDGIRVRAGNRRTVAAVEAGLSEIPVVVWDIEDDDQERISAQLVENTQREALSTADTIAAVEQLALLGVSPTRIAKRTSLSRERVSAALTAAGSPEAIAAAAQKALTLEHAAWLAEFDDDPGLRDDLLEDFTGDIPSDRHALELARDRLAAQRAGQTLAAQITADTGARLYTGDYYNDGDCLRLSSLRTPEGETIDEEAHQDCPGHSFTLERRDWGTPTHVQDGIGFRVVWLCDDWPTHGHQEASIGPLHDTPAAAASPEARIVERRRTIALNRAGEAALRVRREWLTEFTGRKTPPKDAPAFMWSGLASDHVAVVQDAPWGLDKVEEILHIPDTRAQPEAAATWLAAQSQTRLAHLLLCGRLWSYEQRCDKSIWRAGKIARFYLQALEQWGYALSEVEKVATGDLSEQAAFELIGGQEP